MASADSYVSLSKTFFDDLVAVSESSKQTSGVGDSKSENQVKKVSSQVDFKRLAEKSLGSKWSKIKKVEREEFLKVLQELLEVIVYPQARKISVKSEEIKYQLESGSPGRVKVLSQIEREKRGEKINQKLELVLIFDAKTQKIMDAVIEGEEISSNLKRQFTEALKKQSFASIIEKMRKRVKEARDKATS
jgi:ABC-type transporter MlaC component